MRWTFDQVKANCARFGKKAFGSATQMNVENIESVPKVPLLAAMGIPVRQRALPPAQRHYRVQVRTEGHPAHDPAWRAWMLASWERFFKDGFGVDAQIKVEVWVEAGSEQDGKPSQQLIMLPPLELPSVVGG